MKLKDNQIFIPNNVPSLKNSKQVSRRGGRTIVTSSKTVKAYLKAFGIKSFDSRKREVEYYKTIPMTFPLEDLQQFFKDLPVNAPVKVGFYFIRGSRHRADFQNLVQLLADLFVSFRLIEDDNMDYFLPFPLEIEGKYYHHDKESPGVILEIL